MISIGEIFLNKFSKILNLFNENKYYFKINLVTFSVGKRKYRFNINQLNYEKSEIREIKKKIINHYYHNIKLNNSFKQHYFNHLIGINVDISKKANLIKYLLDKNFNIEKISTSFVSKNDKTLLANFNIYIKDIKPTKTKLNPLSIILWLIEQYKQYNKKKKYFLEEKSNFDPNIKYTRMLRAWFALSENIYTNKLKKSLNKTIIYVTPHIIKGKISHRQKRYLEHLKNKKRNYFFYIPKIDYCYLLKIGIKIYFSSFPAQIKIPLLQIIKERMEIDDIIRYINIKFPSIKEFYTKEEFFPESVYLTEKLKKSKIKVINSAHGIGVYGTIVNYDLFYIFTKIQKNHYNGRGTAKLEFFKSIEPLKKEQDTKKDFALLFIHQNVLSTPSRKSKSSSTLYKEILSYIEKIALDLDIPVFAKYHPGSTKKDKILSNNIKIIEKIEDLPNKYNYLATTLHSSYVLELLETMPFLIINPQNRINMKDFFPNNRSIYALTYKEFREKIEEFFENQESYYEYWDKLFSLVYNI